MAKVRRPSIIITAMVLLLIIGGGYRLYGLLSGSSEGTVRVGSVAEQTITPPASRIPIENTSARFTYSAELSQTRIEKPVDPVLSNQSFVKQQFSPWSISVQVIRLPEGSLEDTGSYNYRNTLTAQFTKTQRTVGQYTTTVFVDKTNPGFNQSVYFKQSNRAVSITASGGTTKEVDQLQAEIDAIITSWEWR